MRETPSIQRYHGDQALGWVRFRSRRPINARGAFQLPQAAKILVSMQLSRFVLRYCGLVWLN
jgi:hypothetical protein